MILRRVVIRAGLAVLSLSRLDSSMWWMTLPRINRHRDPFYLVYVFGTVTRHRGCALGLQWQEDGNEPNPIQPNPATKAVGGLECH